MNSPLSSTPVTCPHCKQEGLADHVCPFKWEINDDKETLCNCCDSCRQDCADDI